MPGKFHGQRTLVDYSPQGHEESDTTEHIHGHGGDNLSKFSIYLKASLIYKLTAIFFIDKNILEVTNSKITEAEVRTNEVEDRMVEINEAERKK